MVESIVNAQKMVCTKLRVIHINGICPDIALDTSARTVILIGRWSVATTHRMPIPPHFLYAREGR
jgi:hypothetical protein